MTRNLMDTVIGNNKEQRELRETTATHGEGHGNLPNQIIYTTSTQTLPHTIQTQSHIKPGGILKTKPHLFLSFDPNKKPINISNPNHKIPTSLFSHKTNSQWIFYCGATDTMTFDPCDLLPTHSTNRTHIQTVNGECVPVDQAGSVDI